MQNISRVADERHNGVKLPVLLNKFWKKILSPFMNAKHYCNTAMQLINVALRINMFVLNFCLPYETNSLLFNKYIHGRPIVFDA